MEPDNQQPRQEYQEDEKPVAYDTEGRPLYAAPPRPADPSYNAQPGPQFVHLSRESEPLKPAISDEARNKHETSTQNYPSVHLSDVEYIVDTVPRHMIGITRPLLFSGLVIAIIVAFLINYSLIVSTLGLAAIAPPFWMAFLGGLLVIVIIALACYGAIWVYTSNKFFLTNESVIQEIQQGFFSHQEQTISLANVEDVSYSQVGPLQMMFDYGTIRLSTEGDEATYMFNYAVNPKRQVAVLNDAIEDFKNGRQVDHRE